MWFGDSLCSQEGVGAGDEDGVADGDFSVGNAEDGGWVLGCYMSGYAGVPACYILVLPLWCGMSGGVLLHR